MVFGTNQRLKNLNNPPLNIQHQYTSINYTDTYKYLGLLLKSNLNLADHIQKVISKASSRVNLLRKMRPMMDSKTASTVYNAMILPFLTNFSLTLTGSIPEYQMIRIDQLEKRAQKIIGPEYEVPKSNKVIRNRSASFVHRCLTNDVCSSFLNYYAIVETQETGEF